jgi:cell shape-determining protein MreC
MEGKRDTIYWLMARIALLEYEGKDATELWFKVYDKLYTALDEESAKYIYRVLRSEGHCLKKLRKLEDENEALKKENEALRRALREAIKKELDRS